MGLSYFRVKVIEVVPFALGRKWRGHTAENDPVIKIQLASRNQLEDLVWCKFGHVPRGFQRGRNLRTPPIGVLNHQEEAVRALTISRKNFAGIEVKVDDTATHIDATGAKVNNIQKLKTRWKQEKSTAAKTCREQCSLPGLMM